jgi:hypothetical protein
MRCSLTLKQRYRLDPLSSAPRNLPSHPRKATGTHRVCEAVSDALLEGDAELLIDEDDVREGLAVSETEALRLGDAGVLGLFEGELPTLADFEGVGGPEADEDAVMEAEAATEVDGDAVVSAEPETEGDSDADELPVADSLEVSELVCVPEGELEGEDVRVRDAVPVGLLLTLPVPLGLGVRDLLALSEELGETELDRVTLEVGVGVPERLGVPETDGELDGEELRVTENDGVMLGVGVPDGVGAADPGSNGARATPVYVTLTRQCSSSAGSTVKSTGTRYTQPWEAVPLAVTTAVVTNSARLPLLSVCIAMPVIFSLPSALPVVTVAWARKFHVDAVLVLVHNSTCVPLAAEMKRPVHRCTALPPAPALNVMAVMILPAHVGESGTLSVCCVGLLVHVQEAVGEPPEPYW